jgi:hypothetical protein
MIPTTRGSSAPLMSIPPNAYDYSTWTADTPTNVTETLLTGVNGPTMRLASATATTRGGGRYTVGTRISAAFRGYSRTSLAANVMAGQAVYLCRPGTDTRRLVATVCAGVAGGASYATYLLLFTSKDTYSILRFSSFGVPGVEPAMRLGSRAGTTTLEVSGDGGVNWETLYSASDATAFGSAGAGTHVGIGAYTESATAVVNAYAPYALVEA